MKLNDPFGRMARRREREYQSLSESLRKAGLTDRDKAEALIASLRSRTKKMLWIAVPATLALALIFREYAIYVVAFGLLTILWLSNTTQRGTEYISRYIEEECSGETPEESDTAAAGDDGEEPPADELTESDKSQKD